MRFATPVCALALVLCLFTVPALADGTDATFDLPRPERETVELWQVSLDARHRRTLDTPVGKVTYRAIDHQSTMGAYVGKTKLEDGKGVMVDWTYLDGADYLPSDEEVKKLRPATD